MHYDKPTEGIWSLLKRSMANFAAADLDGLVRIVKRKLKKIQYRPHLIDGHRPENRALVTTCTTSSAWLAASGSRPGPLTVAESTRFQNYARTGLGACFRPPDIATTYRPGPM
jgi:hypothetical protein